MASGTSSVVDSSTSNPNTSTGGVAAIDHSSGSGASPVEPSSLLVSLLYYLIQNGANVQPWAFAAMAFALQSSTASNLNGGQSRSLTPSAADQHNQDSSGSANLEAPFPTAPATSSGGVQGQSQPFVYQDSVSSNPASNLVQSNSLAATLTNPQFDSWGAVLSAPLATGQALAGAAGPIGGSSSSLLAATSLAQGHGGGSA